MLVELSRFFCEGVEVAVVGNEVVAVGETVVSKVSMNVRLP